MSDTIYDLLRDKNKIIEIFYENELHDLDAFEIINPETNLLEEGWKDRTLDNKKNYILDAYLKDKTIIVKHLEKFIDLTDTYKNAAFIEAEITYNGALPERNTLGWIAKENDYYGVILWGERTLTTRYRMNEITMETYLKFKPEVPYFLPKGKQHKSLPKGPSCHLLVYTN